MNEYAQHDCKNDMMNYKINDITLRNDKINTNSTDKESDNEADDIYINESLFIDREYQLQHITFQCHTLYSDKTHHDSDISNHNEIHIIPLSHINIDYYALYNATTSYDLTGQVVWPATQILGNYLLYIYQLTHLRHSTHTTNNSSIYHPNGK